MLSPCFFAECGVPILPDEVECIGALPTEPCCFGFPDCVFVIIDAPHLVATNGKEEGEYPPVEFSKAEAAGFRWRFFFHRLPCAPNRLAFARREGRASCFHQGLVSADQSQVTIYQSQDSPPAALRLRVLARDFPRCAYAAPVPLSSCSLWRFGDLPKLSAMLGMGLALLLPRTSVLWLLSSRARNLTPTSLLTPCSSMVTP